MNSEDKKKYMSPEIDVIEIKIETLILQESNHTTNATRNNYGTANQDIWD